MGTEAGMRGFGKILFGAVMPGVEVVLVLIGLCLMGWDGLVYALTGQGKIVSLGGLGVPEMAADGAMGALAGGLVHWLLCAPLSGVCLVLGIALFFLMPPAYAHS